MKIACYLLAKDLVKPKIDPAAGPLQHLAGELLLLNLCLKAGNVWVEYLVFMIRVSMCNSYHNHNAGWLTKL